MKLLSFILFLLPALAMASNPWAERYAKQKAELPAELPTVERAISDARQHTAIESSIHYREVAKAVADALKTEGAGESIEAKINTYRPHSTLLKHHSPLTFELSNVDFDARALTWTASLYPYDYEKPLAPLKLSGSYDEMMEVPVLARRVRREEVITDADIKWQKVQASRLRQDTAMQIEQMIGMAPRRTISPNRSVRMAELVKPSIVKKNDQITLEYRTNAMEIKALGEAMEEGAAGDIIRIRNKDSRQPIQARIIASGLAEVMPLGVLAQAGRNY